MTPRSDVLVDADITVSGETTTAAQYIERDEAHAAHTYHPLPVVLREGNGVWVTDVDGRRYLDCLAGYSALNFGHSHPVIVAAAREQLERLTLTSRAFHHDLLGAFCAELAELCGVETVLPMNSGAEAVESALKLARKWGYEVKGVEPDRANIVVARDNFHGRTISIVSFSSDRDAKRNFGPFTPGFREVVSVVIVNHLISLSSFTRAQHPAAYGFRRG